MNTVMFSNALTEFVIKFPNNLANDSRKAHSRAFPTTKHFQQH